MVKKIFLFYVAIIVFGLLMFCQPTSSRDRCYASGCSANKYKGGYCFQHYVLSGNYASDMKKSKAKNSKTNNTSTYKSTYTNSSTYSTNKPSTSKRSYSMPDCDDYDYFDDFMDNWDGNMPDGSDAQEYWENW